ncbi:MAG TPA: aminodeoxychorismate/anthranilate synthase component II [Armatimonadota bacterium]|jgi:para-aminobenzoate synthetase component 2
MTLVIDNYDSFTYNLVQYLGVLGEEVEVYRNDALSVEQVLERKPAHLVVSPGPCTPKEAGISVSLIQAAAGKVPVLGVCLGHQSIGEAFGGHVIRAPRLMHGKTSPVRHQGTGVFEGLPSPLQAARYHSLIIERETMPKCLEVTADTEEGEVMAVRHRELPVVGLQFHPESVVTQGGMDLLRNFLKLRGMPS